MASPASMPRTENPFLAKTAAQDKVPGTSDDIGRVDLSKANSQPLTVLGGLNSTPLSAMRRL
jgi:hypothetical protein